MYTVAGTRLTMQWHGAGTTVGTVQGDTFTMYNEGIGARLSEVDESAANGALDGGLESRT
jgi:hypothetical protein